MIEKLSILGRKAGVTIGMILLWNRMVDGNTGGAPNFLASLTQSSTEYPPSRSVPIREVCVASCAVIRRSIVQ